MTRLVVVATKVDKKIKKDLQELAKANDRTVAAEVRQAVIARLDEYHGPAGKKAA